MSFLQPLFVSLVTANTDTLKVPLFSRRLVDLVENVDRLGDVSGVAQDT